MYADDAALPANNADDLQRSLLIFEKFCNENRLYISVPKSYITVFHSDSDDAVVYNHGEVWVDGVKVQLKIYDRILEAVDSFKYLGVVVHANGHPHAHAEARAAAFRNASWSLFVGLSLCQLLGS